MAELDDGRLALPARATARLAGVSDRRLSSWAARGLIEPSTRRQLSPRNEVRLYDFTDLLAVLIVRELLESGAHPRTIARLVDHLRREYEHPLTQVRWAVVGSRVYVQHFDGSWVGDDVPSQTVLWQLLDLEPLRARIRDAAGRRRVEDIGRVEKRRGVMGSKPVFAGTRVPVEAVHAYLRSGADVDRILQAYPQLDAKDVALAEDLLPVVA